MKQEPRDWHTRNFIDYAIAIAAKREIAIRAGQIEPRTPTEHRWAAEGHRPIHQLESGTKPATDAGEQA